MRSRLQIHFKALTFSLSAVGALLFLAFFFYDGPLEMPMAELSAQATESNPLSPLAAVGEDKASQERLVNPFAALLPVGFKPQWRQVSLDQDQVHLKILKSPFFLAQTHHRSGVEAFQYASYLFEQMAHDIHNPSIASEMQALSLQAQNMGNAISQADAYQFSGPPTSDMEHLQVRSSILYYLSGLNSRPVVNVQYNQNGKVLAQELGQSEKGGEEIRSFMARVDAILNQPEAKAYPQTMQLVKQESSLLQNLASHLTMRWESTLDCPKNCGNVAVYLRVYTHQTLPEHTLAAVTI